MRRRGDEILQQLASHLEDNPNDLEGWRLLAASYMQLGRYDEGRAAYQRLWALTPQPDDELKIAYAESQILADRAALTGEAGRLVEEVLATSPGHLKALWYGGFVALELGRDDVVRSRWTSLLARNPPEDIARIVQGQLAELGGVSLGRARRLRLRRSGPRSSSALRWARGGRWRRSDPTRNCSSSRVRPKAGRRSP